MIDVCILTNTKYNRAVETLTENNKSFRLRHLRDKPWTFKEFQQLLVLTDYGLDDIISNNGLTFKKLQAQGIQFEALCLTEAYELIVQNPSLLKLPLVTDYTTRTRTGINGADAFIPRSKRKIQFLHSREQHETIGKRS